MKLPVVTCRLAEQRCFYHFAPFSFFFLLSPLFLSAGKVCPAGKLGNFCGSSWTKTIDLLLKMTCRAPVLLDLCTTYERRTPAKQQAEGGCKLHKEAQHKYLEATTSLPTGNCSSQEPAMLAHTACMAGSYM